jgi:hypothetical protein
MRKMTAVLAVAGITLGLLVADAGAVFARGRGGPPSAAAATGTATCAVKASLSFNPPLLSSASGNSTVTLNAQLVKCSTTSSMHRTTGHIQANLGSLPTNTCTAPTPPAFSGVGVRWTPPSKVQGSVISDTSTGTTTVLGSGQAQVSYTGVTATGSFATSTGTLTLTSRDTATNLGTACSGTGLDAITFSGSATL